MPSAHHAADEEFDPARKQELELRPTFNAYLRHFMLILSSSCRSCLGKPNRPLQSFLARLTEISVDPPGTASYDIDHELHELDNGSLWYCYDSGMVLRGPKAFLAANAPRDWVDCDGRLIIQRGTGRGNWREMWGASKGRRRTAVCQRGNDVR